MRYKIFLSYNGSAFKGWQIQNNAPSVQGYIQKALSTLLKGEYTITGAGRTDTDVHATRYVAHLETDSPIDCDMKSLIYKLNSILPKEIVIHDFARTNDDFHARFAANRREYRYFLHRKKDPFMNDRSYLYTFPLDINKMNEAAALLAGTRDCSCFEKSGGNSSGPVCTIYEAKWECYTPDHVRLLGYPGGEGDYLVFTVSANRFLRNMVRAIVGTLLDVGKGKKSLEDFKKILESGDRCAAGESVPGKALFLCDVNYPEEK